MNSVAAACGLQLYIPNEQTTARPVAMVTSACRLLMASEGAAGFAGRTESTSSVNSEHACGRTLFSRPDADHGRRWGRHARAS
jgi:hypothetical protein